jgi:AraC family transcriptional regulator, exoenzyme S synthesis regulatory protein ExsA
MRVFLPEADKWKKRKSFFPIPPGSFMIEIYDNIRANPDYFKQISVNDILFVHYRCPQKENIVKLLTRFSYLIYSLSGERHILKNNERWKMTKDVSLFVKKSAYSQEWYKQEDWVVLCFFIPDEYLRKLLHEYRSILPMRNASANGNESIIPINVNETTKAFFYSIVPYFSQNPPPSSTLIEIKFRELFLNILGNPANAPLVNYINELDNYDKPFLPEIMESNYMYNLSLAEFAKLSHRSVASFKRDFIKIFHASPGKWLLQKRVELGNQLLTTTNANINEIALESGFESSAHFSRVFKEKYGYSPKRSRKRPVVEN